MVALLIEYFKPVVLFVLIGAILCLSHRGDRETPHRARAAFTHR